MTNDRMTNDGMRHQPQRARRAQSEEFITKTHRRERGERRDFLEYCSAYSAVSAIKNPFCSGVYFGIRHEFHELARIFSLNSCKFVQFVAKKTNCAIPECFWNSPRISRIGTNFFLLIRVNSYNSWQKRPTAQFLSVFGIRH